jgi:hypothetical protein
MIPRAFLTAAILSLVIPGPPRCYASHASQSEKREIKEQEIVAKIAREKNPGKKARLEIRLARMKLLDADSAYRHNNFLRGEAMLQEYWRQIDLSWKTLDSSPRGAARHLKACKELEIGLREDGRRLEDLRDAVPYPDNDPIEKVAKESSRLHSRVMEVLFPASAPAPKSKKPGRLSGSQWAGSAVAT